MTKWGVVWDATDSSPALTWSESASTWNTTTSHIACDAATPWMLKRVNLADDGTVNAVSGTNSCYTDTDVANMGQCMVQMPKFYYKIDGTAPAATSFLISDAPASGYVIHPAFQVGGATQDYIYVGAYEGYYNATTGMLESNGDNKTPTAGTIPVLRGYAKARDVSGETGWQLSTVQVESALKLLYLIEWASFLSQTKVGYGYVDDGLTTPIATGTTDWGGNQTVGDTAAEQSAMSLRGVENFWGSARTYSEGLNIEGPYKVYIAPQSVTTPYDETSYSSPYVDTTFTLPHPTAYITGLQTSGTYDWAMIPSTASGGNGATYLCDQLYVYAQDSNINMGDTVTRGSYAGAFAWRASYNINASWYGRLMYMPH